jgi:hypothetical protein
MTEIPKTAKEAVVKNPAKNNIVIIFFIIVFLIGD